MPLERNQDTTDGIDVRQAQKDDLPALTAILLAMERHYEPAALPDEATARARIEKALFGPVPIALAFLAVSRGQPVGVAVVSKLYFRVRDYEDFIAGAERRGSGEDWGLSRAGSSIRRGAAYVDGTGSGVAAALGGPASSAVLPSLRVASISTASTRTSRAVPARRAKSSICNSV